MSSALGVGAPPGGRDLIHDPKEPRRSARAARCLEDPELPMLDFTDSSSDSGAIHAARSAPHTTVVSETSEMNLMSLNTEANTTEGISIDVDADISIDVDADIPDSPKRPRNMRRPKQSKFATDSDSMLPSSIDSDACATHSDQETDYKSLKDISQITKCSDHSLYDPLSYSALAGPLHSTLNYTLGTTPSKGPKPVDPNCDPNHNSVSSLCQIEEERPSPMGMDDIHFHAPFNKILNNLTTTPKYAQTSTDTTCSSLDESTPIIITKFRRRTKRSSLAPTGGETPDDSGLCSYKGSSNTTEDTPTTIRKLSRDEYLTLNEDGSREGSHSQGSGGNDTDGLDSASGTPSIMQEGRQVPGVSMTGLRQPGVGLSMGDLLGLVSWTAEQDSVSSSVDGTRASEASPGALTLPSSCSDGLRSTSDITSMSSFQFSSMTTESSYKESDASSLPNQTSESLSQPVLKSKYPASIMHSRAMSTDSLSEPCAPMNSPNTTADDFSMSSRPVSNQSCSSRALTSTSSQDNFKCVWEQKGLTVGPRPPCIGGEQLSQHVLPQQQQQQQQKVLHPEPKDAANVQKVATTGATCAQSLQPPLPAIPDNTSESDAPIITPLPESDSDTGSDEIDVDKHTPRRTPQQATGMKRLTLMRRLRNFKRHFRANSRGRKSSGSSSKNTSKESR